MNSSGSCGNRELTEEMMQDHFPRKVVAAAAAITFVLLVASNQPVKADSGAIAGHAVAQIGTVVSVPFGGPTTTMDPSGAPQSAGTPLNRTQDANLGLLGILSAGFTSGNATQHCEGGPASTPVWAECYARVENAVFGLNLPASLGGGPAGTHRQRD
jgi:hypothetical protein